MNISGIKQKIIQILFILAVLLVVANIIASKFSVKPVNAKLENVSPDIVNAKFLGAINDFGLKKDWITLLRNKKSGSSDYNYSVNIPKDLPIPVVISEIYDAYITSNVKLACTEEKTGGETVLKINSDNRPVISAVFNYDENISRNAGSIGILVKGLELLKKKDMDALIEFPQTFAAILLPSQNAIAVSDSLLNNRKEYAVLLNDDIKDLDYKLSGGFTRNRIKLVIRSIIGAFPDALSYIIDDNSGLYNSPAYPFIKDEFAKRKINLIRESSFIQIEEGRAGEVSSQLWDIVKPTRTGDEKIVMVNADDFVLLRPKIFSLIKIGYKFVNPSVILADKNKSGKAVN